MTFHFKVGNFACIAIADTFARYPLAMFLTNISKDKYQPWLRERGEDPEEIELPYICLFVHADRKQVLIDTGIGMEGGGRLMEHLHAEGIDSRAIGTVILSHGHPDHIGGSLDQEGKPAFPNARYVMFQKEWDFWESEPRLSELPVDGAFKEHLLAAARRNLPPIKAQADLIQPGTEIVPGVAAIAAFGHSPGQMALEISSTRERLIFAADAIIHPLNLPYPEAVGATDHDPEQMVTTRLRLLEQATREECLVQTSHFAFPGLGRVAAAGSRWEWQPVSAVPEAQT
jgi:glyoxylase-like metal-dependent hydrolase (beta-lactamase superfamily II)